MPRPCLQRRICFSPTCRYFKPAGIPLKNIQEVELKEDELEAMRLADDEGLYHEKAAKKMKISRQTFDRILRSARKKIAEAMIKGKALKILTNKKTKGKNYENRRRLQ